MSATPSPMMLLVRVIQYIYNTKQGRRRGLVSVVGLSHLSNTRCLGRHPSLYNRRSLVRAQYGASLFSLLELSFLLISTNIPLHLHAVDERLCLLHGCSLCNRRRIAGCVLRQKLDPDFSYSTVALSLSRAQGAVMRPTKRKGKRKKKKKKIIALHATRRSRENHNAR